MRVLHIDYGILEYSELESLRTEITSLVNSCDNFTHYEYEHFTQNDKHGITVRMELMENNRPQANDLPAEPAKSIITFSAFCDPTRHQDPLRQLSYLLFELYDILPFHNDTPLIFDNGNDE